MRNAIHAFLVLSFSALLFALPACEDEPSAEEKFLTSIAGKWTPTNIGVSLDGVAVNGAFKGFSITLTDQKTFTTTFGNTPIWTASGKFTPKPVSTNVGFSLVRQDGVEISVERPADNRMTLKFQFVSKGSRTSSVSGRYIFDLQRL